MTATDVAVDSHLVKVDGSSLRRVEMLPSPVIAAVVADVLHSLDGDDDLAAPFQSHI